jgi:transposase-like protein
VIEEFLSVLREVGSVSAAAKQLGLNRSTCSNWANDAGIASTCLRRPSAKQIHYLRLRQEGANRRDAALAVGASNSAPTNGTANRKRGTRLVGPPLAVQRLCDS